MADLPLISKITLPSGTTYEIKDAWSRDAIGALGQVMNFLGVCTDALTDGSTTNPIHISGETDPITAGKGDVVILSGTSKKEFIWTGSKWAEFGDLSNIVIGANTANLVTGTIPRTEYSVGSGTTNVTITATATSAMGTGATFTTTVTPSEKQLKKETINAVSANATNVLKSVTASQVDINTTSEGGEKIVQKVAVAKLGTSSFTPKVAGDSVTFGKASIVPAVSGTIALPNNASHVEVGTGLSSGTSVLTGLGTPTTTTLTKTPVIGLDGTESKMVTLSGSTTTSTGAVQLVENVTGTALPTTTITGVSGSTTTHDTPTLNTTNFSIATVDKFGNNETVGSASGWNAGSFPTLSASGSSNASHVGTANPTGATIEGTYDSATENLTLSFNYGDIKTVTVSDATLPTYSLTGGSLPTLTVTDTVVATKGTTSIRLIAGPGTGSTVALGTSLTAGTAVTVPTAAANATTVVTGGTGIDEVSKKYISGSVVVPKAASSVDVASISANTDVITSITPTTTKISVANASTTSTNIATAGTAVDVATLPSGATTQSVLANLADGTAFTYATGGTVATSATGGAQIATGEETVKYIHTSNASTSSVDVAVLDGTKSVVTGLEAYSSGDKVLNGITSATTTVNNAAAVNAVADITKIAIPAQTFTEQSTGHTHPVSAS